MTEKRSVVLYLFRDGDAPRWRHLASRTNSSYNVKHTKDKYFIYKIIDNYYQIQVALLTAFQKRSLPTEK